MTSMLDKLITSARGAAAGFALLGVTCGSAPAAALSSLALPGLSGLSQVISVELSGLDPLFDRGRGHGKGKDEDQDNAPAGQAFPAAESFSLTGVVEGVDYSANVVRLRSGADVLPVIITPTTTIAFGHRAGSMSDIRRGARLSISGAVRDGAFVARTVTILK